ncbi:helix-turn-helix transcriptional regulator [Agathobaculum sp. NTUH-O15-33]|uniref:helix-turn-helix domain-containing protein n=1 Tax=Agathobaculum sp. NTUH-O15-33 TaxID=3079302 RepID=UPI00295896EE|nr:helix-turn-helix transcriptional regulator [Agathobaculum sp. NTUH-O15-33]WNX85335.1 helix-turn-helix transcriptional regulator [Agathobaculum sp. NTUH-O15-33]
MSKILQDISIGDNLRRIRQKQGLTQREVCAQLAIAGRPMSQSTYAQIETGVRNIFVSDLIAIKSILKAEYSDFFNGLVPIMKF